MQNLALAETVLANIQRNPETFRMRQWGIVLPPRGLIRKIPGGYVACLAGHTLLASGYMLTSDNTFKRGRERVWFDEVAVTAKEELGLTMAEYDFRYPWHQEEVCTLFCGGASNEVALASFAALVNWERAKLITAA